MTKCFCKHGFVQIADLPALIQLGLSSDELMDLQHQGFIRREQRGGKTVYRLRYRHDGRMKSRYVSSRDVTAVEAELAVLQKNVRARRNLAQLARHARSKLRERNERLKALLEECGYHLHGNQFRRRRSSRQG